MAERTEIYKRAIELVTQGWTSGTFARNSAGADVDANSEFAEKWCSSGAIARAQRDLDPDVQNYDERLFTTVEDAIIELYPEVQLAFKKDDAYGGLLVYFNDVYVKTLDGNPVDHVVAVFKKAAA